MDTGLEGIVAATTTLSGVDGEAGRLVLRGHSLDSIVGRMRFEDLLALFFDGYFEPDGSQDVRASLGAARLVTFELLKHADGALVSLPVVDAMRALMARIPDRQDYDGALELVAAPAVLLTGLLHLRSGSRPVTPDASLTHAADFLRMLTGRMPSAAQADALERYLVTILDHGLNASTFTARVVASTQAGLTSVVLAALGALKGPLHGGAPGPVLDMLDAIAIPENAAAWIGEALGNGRRIMGFGHRVYRVRDPRADAVEGALTRLCEAGAMGARLTLALAVEAEALRALEAEKPGRALKTNVEFYTALLLEALEFPREAFTGVFAAGRVVGWIAHAREQAATGRLVRPESRYVGPPPRTSVRTEDLKGERARSPAT